MNRQREYTFEELVERLALELLERVGDRKPLIVGIDGPDCSGKSSLCQGLMAELMSDHSMLALHFDDYLVARSKLDKSVKTLARRFREDYFSWSSLERTLRLFSEKPGENIDLSIVIVEGLFLFEVDRFSAFDFRIRLEVDDRLMLSRAMSRDVGVLGDEKQRQG